MKITSKIMGCASRSLLGCLLCLSVAASAQEEPSSNTPQNGGWSTVSYNAVPIEIEIQANQESILKFPWRVNLGSSSDMLSKVRNIPIGDQVFLTPLMEFDKQRFYAEDPESGAMMLIDITANKDAPPRMLNFVDNRANLAAASVPARSAESTASSSNSASAEGDGEYSYSIVSRFAFQNIYSPERLIVSLDDLNEQPMARARSVNDLVIGENVVATPITEWRTGSGLFVTQLLLRNMGPQTVDLDPRNLRHTVDSLASSYWSTQLASAGMPGDETTMVVISTSSWNSSINQRGSQLISDMGTGR